MSANRVYIHIGSHKTGTTSFQQWSVNNRLELMKYRVLYPYSGCSSSGNHHMLAWAFKFSQATKYTDVLGYLKSEIYKYPGYDILISSEEFEYLANDEVCRVRDFFSSYDVRILICFRPQHDIIRSQYSEWIKQALTSDCFSVFWRFHIGLAEYDYLRLLSCWLHNFSVQNVIIISHQELSFLKYGVISSIISIMDLPESSFSFEEKENVSPSREVISAWRYMLSRIEFIYSVKFSLYDNLLASSDYNLSISFRSIVFQLFIDAKRLLDHNISKQSLFIGYNFQEDVICYKHFNDSNLKLFELAGRKLWVPHFVEENYREHQVVIPNTLVDEIDSLLLRRHADFSIIVNKLKR